MPFARTAEDRFLNCLAAAAVLLALTPQESPAAVTTVAARADAWVDKAAPRFRPEAGKTFTDEGSGACH